jgi:hypothetical protein
MLDICSDRQKGSKFGEGVTEVKRTVMEVEVCVYVYKESGGGGGGVRIN